MIGSLTNNVQTIREVIGDQTRTKQRKKFLKTLVRRKTGRTDKATKSFPRMEVSANFSSCLLRKVWTLFTHSIMIALIAESRLADEPIPELMYITASKLSW